MLSRPDGYFIAMAEKRKFEQMDQQFEHFLDSVRFEFVETEFTPEKKVDRRKRADADDLEFCGTYFRSIFHLPFNELHRRTANLGPGKYTRSGFRKSGKSAFVYISYIVKALAQGIGGVLVINCQTDDISLERTAAILRLIKKNPLLMYDYRIEIQQDLKGNYIVNNTRLVNGSVRQGMRSITDDEFIRVRRAVNDDLYDKTNVTSKNWTERVVDFIEYEVSGQMEDDGISVTLCNATAEEAPVVTLRNKNPKNHFGLPALDENGESTWPEYRTTERWREFKQDLPWDVWAGDYMDEPAVKGDVMDPEWLRSINTNLVKIIASITAIDPAHGTSPSACDKGLATVGATDKNEVVVLDMYIRKEGYFQVFDYVDALRSRVPFWKVLLFENDFNQWGFAAPYYTDWMLKRKKTLPIAMHNAKDLVTEHRGADKESRLLTLVHPHQTSMIYYAMQIMDTPDFRKFRAQYLSLGKAQGKLDGLDALATAYIMIWAYIETGIFIPIKQRVFSKLDWFRKAR
jgi:hypothetical protein